MSMSDCPKCWDTPCTCGYEYEGWTKDRIQKQILVLQKVLEEKEQEEANSYVGTYLVSHDILVTIAKEVRESVL